MGNPARDGKLIDPRNNVEFDTTWVGGRRDAYRDTHTADGVSFRNIFYSRKAMPYAYVGTWGADRNGNGIWDRGRIGNVRMMAVEIDRFPLYDPVMWMKVGQ